MKTGHATSPREDVLSAALPEKYVRCLWYDGRQFLKPRIVSRDGRPVRVVSPGQWNTGRGPDFLDGVFRIGGGGTVCGDVEVHRHRHDWRSHAHRRDPAFGGVRLHVFVLDDGDGDRNRTYAGGPMTEICLRGQTRRGLESSARAIDPRAYPYRAGGARGRCAGAARKLGGERLARFLQAAGEARLREKAARVRRLSRRHGIEQTLYRLILETLGYSAHKGAFSLLAAALPWETVRRIALRARRGRRRASIEAALMGVADLIPAEAQPGWDAESLRAWGRASRSWSAIKCACGAGELPRGAWSAAAQRPVSAPLRRIAGISPLLAACARHGLRSLIRGAGPGPVPGRRAPAGAGAQVLDARPRPALRNLENRLDGLLDGAAASYWSGRCAWGGARLRPPLSLVGGEHRRKIVANVLLPALYAEGGRATATRILRELPAVEPDSRVKTMMARLVGGGAAFPRCWGMAAQQGMLHLHRHFCARDRSGCLRCPVPAYLAWMGRPVHSEDAAPRDGGGARRGGGEG